MVVLKAIAPLLGFLPSLAWLVFFRLEDRLHPEPKKMAAKVFIAGALSAVAASLVQLSLQKTFKANNIGIGEESAAYFLILASIEELIKFAAVYFTIRKSKFFDEPVDAMIYMITAALGFAALENAFFLFAAGSSGLLEIIVLRSVGATLLHAIASGFIGFYWAKKRLVEGIIIAVILHTGFNYLILQFESAPIYATSILIFASFFLFYDFDIIKGNET
ncbi:MAG: PrsW family intramembrane metalloprotease [Candidatus Colwellbacteria bacterium]|nr:PrsW family intramembrane metalloprotease [Candidatus Colwellbacteria bacterium]